MTKQKQRIQDRRSKLLGKTFYDKLTHMVHSGNIRLADTPILNLDNAKVIKGGAYVSREAVEHDARIEDLGCLFLPFPEVWIEYPLIDNNTMRAGIMLNQNPIDEISIGGHSLREIMDTKQAAFSAPADAKFVTVMNVFWEMDIAPDIIPHIVTAFLFHDEDGNAMIYPGNVDNRAKSLVIYPGGAHETVRERTRFYQHLSSLVAPGQFPMLSEQGMDESIQIGIETAFYMIALLNMRNVDLELVQPSRKVARKWKKKTGRDMVEYHLIRIHANKGRVYEAGEIDPNAPHVGKARHWVRGHVREYTDAAPLFGKIVGKIWVPAHVRGHGETKIESDYEIIE